MYGGYPSRANEIKPSDKDQPLDTVSCLVWDPYKSDPCFIASSWDGYVRYYIVKQSSSSSMSIQKAWSMFLQHPVLCCDINEDNILFAGLATGDIAAISLKDNQVVRLGAHDAPICGIFWIKDKNCLVSLGYDNLIRFWTLDGGNKPQMEIKLPLKTHTVSFDNPYLLIGSIQSTISIVNLKNLPNCKFPRNNDDYVKVGLERFSKFNCSRVLAEGKKIALGTVDGRCVVLSFRENMDNFTTSDPLVSRSQKKTDNRLTLFGQVDCVDIGYHSYQSFAVIGGTEDLSAYNIIKKNKGTTYISTSSSIGAATAVRLSSRLDFIVYATGSDWTKGIHELQNLKKPKIGVTKLTSSDLRDYVSK